MRSLEKKVDALMRLALAETDRDREVAVSDIRCLLDSAEEPAQDVDSMIRAALLELGVPDGVRGHKYLITAIELAVNDPSILDHMIQALYPAVAQVYGTTWRVADHRICDAIEAAFNRCDVNILSAYFGNTINGNKGKATNREFIARVANDIRARVQ